MIQILTPFDQLLNSTRCHTIDQVSLEDQVDDQIGRIPEHGTCDQKVVVISIRCKQCIQTDSGVNLLCITEYQHRPWLAVVPGTHCTEDCHGSKCRFCDRHHNLNTDTITLCIRRSYLHPEALSEDSACNV